MSVAVDVRAIYRLQRPGSDFIFQLRLGKGKGGRKSGVLMLKSGRTIHWLPWPIIVLSETVIVESPLWFLASFTAMQAVILGVK